jgi:cytidylate kinase
MGGNMRNVPAGPEPELSEELVPDTPLHGFRGDGGTGAAPTVPLGLTIAVSREAGARGGTIGRRVGGKLSWAVFDQEVLEYMAQDTVASQGVAEELAPDAAAWVEARLEQLLREQDLSQNPSVVNLARVVLTLGAAGNAVLIGRGAGCILPRETTLNVRIVAPLPERVAYMSQWLRLTETDAADLVRQRDIQRNEFISTHFHRHPGDVHQYDLILNTSLLGEDACAELIAQAARARAADFSEPDA